MHLSLEGRPDQATAIGVIHAGLDHGMTLIDTADVYCLDDDDLGHNERLIATALRSWRGDRDSITVATKGGLRRPKGRWERDGRPAHLRAACENSLRALRVDQIALYQLHAPDEKVPFESSVEALARLQEEEKIRWVGLSNVSVEQIRRAQRIVPIATVQNRLNPFFREAITDGVVEFCGAEGIGFLAYSPTGGGRLTKKLPAHPVAAALGARYGVSAHQVVLAWVLAQGPSVIAIPSARTVAHVTDSAAAGSLTLSADDLAEIDRAEFSRA